MTSSNQTNQQILDSVNWGCLGYQERYEEWLADRSLTGGLTAVLFLIIAVSSLLLAGLHGYSELDIPMSTGILTISILTLIWLILIFHLSSLDRRMHALEKYLGFYDRRYEVRHALYCSHLGHCLTLHYFHPTRCKKNHEETP